MLPFKAVFAQSIICAGTGKMKLVLAFVFVGLCALVSSSPAPTSSYEFPYKVADKDLLEKQRKVLDLLHHINHPVYKEEHLKIINSYKFDDDKDHFTKPEVVEKIVEYYKNDYKLPKGEIFSISYPAHRDEAIALFDAFYFAKDFETFYKTAVLARHWMNEGTFLYSFSVAIIHRPDCYGIILPPIYEIYPWYFFNTETIQQAYRYKQTWNGHNKESSANKHSGYTITSNYSGHYLNLHPEQSLSYYLEDNEINLFYYTYHLYYPFWMDGKKYGIMDDNRGELYYFIHQQLFARYYMERLSNGMGQIRPIDFDVPVETSYYPSLQYPNGLFFPERPRFARLSDYFYSYGQHVNSHFAYSYTYYSDYSRRIADAIDRGFAFNKMGEKVNLYDEKHGYNELSNLLQGNPDSPDDQYYGPWLGYGRHLMGYSYTPLDKYKVAPSALEHLETTLRDPGFYQLYKHLMEFYDRYQSRLKPYTREQLSFPGVTIDNVEMNRLTTFFDYSLTDLSQAVYYSEDELKRNKTQFKVTAKQEHLNFVEFEYKIHIKSSKDVKAMVKFFIGPKNDEYGRHMNISENRHNFFVLDKFQYDLKTGENVIKGNSFKMPDFLSYRTNFHDLYKQVMDALNGNSELRVEGKQNYFRFPDRYMLPKGTPGGLPFQFYFIVYPYKPNSKVNPTEWTYFYPRPGVGGPVIDEYPLYYPFDRPIKYEKMFEKIPNTFIYETKIFHKKNINAVNTEIMGSHSD